MESPENCPRRRNGLSTNKVFQTSSRRSTNSQIKMPCPIKHRKVYAHVWKKSLPSRLSTWCYIRLVCLLVFLLAELTSRHSGQLHICSFPFDNTWASVYLLTVPVRIWLLMRLHLPLSVDAAASPSFTTRVHSLSTVLPSSRPLFCFRAKSTSFSSICKLAPA